MTAVRFDGDRVRTRLYVDAALPPGTTLALPEAASHHLTKVLRARVGDALLLFNGRDGEVLGRLDAADRRSATVRLDRQVRLQTPADDLWLLPAMVKKPAFETILRQATELGVGRIRPVVTQNGEADRINPDRAAAILREAAEQCERLDVPLLDRPIPLADLLADWPADRPLLACLEGGPAIPLAEAVDRLSDRAPDAAAPALLLGPEGGFAATEVDALRALSTVHPVSLGPRILKADTAAAAALAVVQARRPDGIARPPHR